MLHLLLKAAAASHVKDASFSVPESSVQRLKSDTATAVGGREIFKHHTQLRFVNHARCIVASALSVT